MGCKKGAALRTERCGRWRRLTLNVSCRLHKGALSGACIGCVMFACLASGSWAEESIQYFIDEYGVTHLSNVPADARYKPYPPDAAHMAKRPVQPPSAVTQENFGPGETKEGVDIEYDEPDLSRPPDTSSR